MKKTFDPVMMAARSEQFLLKVEVDKVLDYQALFGNDHPVFVEIGSGKGEFISQYSLLHPEWNFIGFELKQKRVEIILRKLDPERQKNVKIATMCIDEKIVEFMAEGSLAGVFIQHPDPWPKRKHFPRRLIQVTFIDVLSRLIKKGGFLQISTDHEAYAQWTWKIMVNRRDFRSHVLEGISHSPLFDDHVTTFYEREQRRLGYEPMHMLFEKL